MCSRAASAGARSACWGGPLGSQLLWHQHAITIERILHIAGSLQIVEPAAGSQPRLQQLPEECLREVALRLADHHDLVAAAGACGELAAVCAEPRVWRELVLFHFNPHQVQTAISREQDSQPDWQKIYHTLRK